MQLEGISGPNRALIAQLVRRRRRVQKHKRTQDPHAADVIISKGRCRSPTDGEPRASVAAAAGSLTAWSTLKRCNEGALFLPIVGEWMMQEVARGQPNGLTAFDNGTDDVGSQECIADGLAHAGLWDGVFDGNLLIGFARFDSVEPGEGIGDIAQECAVDGFRGVAQNERCFRN